MHRRLVIAIAFCLSAACSSEGQGGSSASVATSAARAPTPTPTPPAATATATAAAKPLASNAVALTPLPIFLEAPDKVNAKTRAFGAGVALIDLDKGEVALTVNQAHGDMAHIKEKYEKEAGFVRWVEQSDTRAVAEVEVDKAKEYYGFRLVPVGELTYECGTLTMRRRSYKSQKPVLAALAVCDGVRGK